MDRRGQGHPGDARGDGRCVAVHVDHTEDAQVEALFDRVRDEHGRLDVLVNNVWGGYEDMRQFGRPFWEQPAWPMVDVGARAHVVACRLAVPLMLPQQRGLIVDTSVAWPEERYDGRLAYYLAKQTGNRLAWGMAQELGEHGVAAIVLSPVGLRDGWVSSGAELRSIHEALATPAALDAQLREDPRLANRQTPEYAGRAVAMLAADPRVLARTGRALKVSDLAHEYVWRRRILAPSRSSPIDAVQATEDGAGADRAGQWLDALDGSVELQRALRALRVVLARVLVRTARRCASLRMIMRSRHSRRRVPTSRSATALARGARTGVSTVRIPSPAARVAKSAP